ncbi:molybdenum cofactor sulfurase [Cellvibrio zantedeschiae]|uniref:Molybdenum cofactor sulfurase n=1 Tax=Cellvibrio zantedeschiae TaxID=1237077 RepID=A0ABQ3B8P8_9GAMM|nr:MOSC domain-containing protein [Cellvibrio zantedeschiae]GGY78890.1 molybdenum cofactor sulfurase [Cellvibrio zantedeschiae]
MSQSLHDLFNTLPQVGRISWIGIRPERKAPMIELASVEAVAGKGLAGDRYSSKNGKRQVTLIQGEHLSAIASMLGKESVPPELLRRNLVVTGINLLALKDKQFRLGDALLEYTGLCHPCSAMEATFGAGGYNAVRGHGGITARIIEGGEIKLGAAVNAIVAFTSS